VPKLPPNKYKIFELMDVDMGNWECVS